MGRCTTSGVPRITARAAAFLLLSALASGCGGARPHPAREARPVRYTPPAAAAQTYATDSSERVAPTAERGQLLRGAIEKASRDAGNPLQGDGRLDQLAAWVSAHLDQDGNPPPHQAVDFVAHHLGLPEPSPHLLVLEVPNHEPLEEIVERHAAEIVQTHPYTHYGSVVRSRTHGATIVAVLSWRWFHMSPVLRNPDPGALRVQGELAAGYGRPELVVTMPDGESRHLPAGSGPKFDVTVPAHKAGSYRVELLAEGARGATVVANFPVFVGMDEPQQVVVNEPLSAGEPLQPDDFKERLLVLANADRSERGLAPLELDAPLGAVAEAHSVDMRDNGFVGHTSPTTGVAADRVKRAGIRTAVVRENLGRGYSAEEVHSGLMQSPAHRANLLDPDVTHVGIGIAISDNGGRHAFLVTELFIRVIPSIDLDDAPEQAAEIINRMRKAKGAPPLELDDTLSEHAQEAAEAYFEQARISDNALVARTSRQLKTLDLPYRRLGTLMTLVSSLAKTAEVDALADPSLTAMGLGVAQGTRKDTLPNAIAVVVVMAWPR